MTSPRQTTQGTPEAEFLRSLVSAPEDGLAYYQLLREARQLHAQGNWAASAEAHRQLVEAYPWDGELWRRLGVASYNTGDFRAAAHAYGKADELGILPYPQWNAVWAAVSHARAGEVEPAQDWLETALRRYRFGAVPTLRQDANPAYAALRELPRFEELVPSDPVAHLSRDEGWRQDVDCLLSEIRRLNPVYSRSPLPDTLVRAAERLRQQIPRLTDVEVAVEIQHLLTLLGQNHNLVMVWAPTPRVTFTQLPVSFYLFPDGLYITAAREGHEELVGARVLRFDDASAESALQAMNSVVPRENEMELVWLGPHYLGMPQILHARGLTRSPEHVVLTVVDRSGRTRTARLDAVAFGTRPVLLPPQIPELPGPPLFLSRPADRFWLEQLPEARALYVQVNQLVNGPEETLAQFGVRVRRTLSEHPDVQNLIVDLRRNNGGNTYLYPELLRTLIGFDQREGNRLFVLIGRNTYSATTNFITEIDRLTNAVFVGEPSGGKPLTLGGDPSHTVLPFSGLSLEVSTVHWQLTSPGDTRLWITPDIPVALSARDYFAGEDPALATILRLISEQPRAANASAR